jgi:hypothetical protein
MAYAAPNAFAGGQYIGAKEVQENVDALRNYINGGMVTGDIYSIGPWVKTQHIMKGEYTGINNTYEFRSGVSYGNLGVNPAGGIGSNFIGQTDPGNPQIAGTGFSFYCDERSDVTITLTAFPRAYSGDTGATVLTAGVTYLVLSSAETGTTYPYTGQTLMAEGEFGVNPRTGAASHVGPGWERRRTYHTTFTLFNMAIGEHKFYMMASAGDRFIPWKYWKVTVQAYART